ncbi:hypothetical protein ACEWY4_011917 [Coilia grayii]|uniref:Uncharacterized protein n=1 Tax=Coilia grayii TaxID=363190 RepID=A0ABD1JZ14_9TELE
MLMLMLVLLSSTGSPSDMVLVLDPLVRDKVSSPPGSRSPQDSPTSDPEVIPSCPPQRRDSGQSDRSSGDFGRRQGGQDSPCSERSVSSQDQPQQGSPSPSGTDSELEPEKDPQPQPPKPSGDVPDGAALSRKAPGSGSLANGLQHDSNTPEVCVSRDAPLSTLTNGKETGSIRVATARGRPNSIRDRMRKFTEPAQTETPPPRRGLQRSVRPLSAHLVQKAGRLEPQAPKTLLPSSGAPSATSQSQGTVGGAESPAKGVDAGGRSEGGSPEQGSPEKGRPDTASPREPEAQPEAPQTPGQADVENAAATAIDDMKTFLTIEIKDGRTMLNQQPQARTLTQTSTSGQRAELTLGLRATPFKISTPNVSTGPSFKVGSMKSGNTHHRHTHTHRHAQTHTHTHTDTDIRHRHTHTNAQMVRHKMRIANTFWYLHRLSHTLAVFEGLLCHFSHQLLIFFFFISVFPLSLSLSLSLSFPLVPFVFHLWVLTSHALP